MSFLGWVECILIITKGMHFVRKLDQLSLPYLVLNLIPSNWVFMLILIRTVAGSPRAHSLGQLSPTPAPF